MKKAALIILLTIFLFSYLRSQTTVDSIVGKKFYITKRVWIAGSIESNNAKEYRLNDVWTATEAGNFWDKAHLLSHNSVAFFNDKSEMLLIKFEEAIKYFDDKYSMFSAKDFKVLNKIYSPFTLKKIMCGKIWLGMNSNQLQLAKGLPTDINRTKTKKTTNEQWVYRNTYINTEYYYFENGILTSIQD